MRDFQLLRDPRLFNKLCQKINADFGCRGGFSCNISCPAFVFKECEWLMNNKGMTLGDAYRVTIRAHIHEDDKKVIKKELVTPKEEYPKRSWREIRDRQDNDERGTISRPGMGNMARNKAKEGGIGLRDDKDRPTPEKGS